ncbi:MAG: NTP transferase domain-containing protein [Alphaproteobacteria bacterium]
MKKNLTILLAAGKGTRMNGNVPKALMPLAGKPMIKYLIDTLKSANLNDIVVVTAPDGELVRREVNPLKTAIQYKQLGTGHAVLAAEESFKNFDGNVIVAFGDQPLYTKQTFEKLLAKRDEGYSIVCVGFRPEDPLRFGRLNVVNGELKSIIEFKDATDEEKKIDFCNSGLMCFDGKEMYNILSEIKNNNAAEEYYLTDAIAIAISKGLKCSAIECSPLEGLGIDTQELLKQIENTILDNKAM